LLQAIVKNIHDLLAKLAWDFSAEQLDHLFECFQVRLAARSSDLWARSLKPEFHFFNGNW
jgi:hypothetical protein